MKTLTFVLALIIGILAGLWFSHKVIQNVPYPEQMDIAAAYICGVMFFGALALWVRSFFSNDDKNE